MSLTPAGAWQARQVSSISHTNVDPSKMYCLSVYDMKSKNKTPLTVVQKCFLVNGLNVQTMKLPNTDTTWQSHKPLNDNTQ